MARENPPNSLALSSILWLTPDVPNGGRALKPGTSVTGKRPDGTKAQVGLSNQVTAWPSPQARDFRSGDNPASPRQVRKLDQGWSQNLNDVAEASTWPTPAAAQDTKGAQASAEAAIDRESRGKQLALSDRAIIFSRPAPAMQPHGVTLSQLRPIWLPLRASVIASHGRATWRRLWKSRAKRRLNPLFVEWLMGWPTGHALCACSGMELSLWQQRMRGALSQLPMASGPWIWLEPAPQPILTQANLFGDM